MLFVELFNHPMLRSAEVFNVLLGFKGFLLSMTMTLTMSVTSAMNVI